MQHRIMKQKIKNEHLFMSNKGIWDKSYVAKSAKDVG